MKLNSTAVLLSGFLLGFAIPAFATLGENEASVDHDRQALSMKSDTVKAGKIPSYWIHEMVSGKTTIREYVSSNGDVFAVSWSGFRHPDLAQLLGKHFQHYQKLEKDNPKRLSRGHRKLESDELVVSFSGHMRSVHGRVYVPSLVPKDVNPEELP